MLFKLLIGFEKFGQDAFLAKAQNIKVSLTSEPALTLLPDPWPANLPTRAEMTAAYTEFETAFDAAQDGSKLHRDDRDQKRAALTAIFKELAPYFESVARKANDITILDATGYDRRHEPVPAPQPLDPPVLQLARGKNSGSLITRLMAV